MSETIAAIATPPYVGGISIIRISGDEAFAVADRVFCPISSGRLSDKSGYTASFGSICDETGRAIDESVATVFRAPKSYTGEDVVELSCHGGLEVTREVLRRVLEAGAKPAGPGEFTKRAFLNGKLSLTQAEAVADLISARSRDAVRAAKSQHDGALAKKIASVQTALLDIAGHLAAWADYPEEDIPELDPIGLSVSLRQQETALRELLHSFDTGKLVREGVDTVIAGRPNVGKSTLMNLLSGEDRSIVTEIAGTTRDIVEETVNLDGILLRLADTAGLRKTADPVEQIGVERAQERMNNAALVLAVFDGSEKLTESDRALIDSLLGRSVVAIVNKNDLPQKIELSVLQKAFGKLICLSAANESSQPALASAIRETVGLANFDTAAPMLANERQRLSAQHALEALAEAADALETGMTMDAVTVAIETAISALLELSGGKVSEEVVDRVFSHFCVGK